MLSRHLGSKCSRVQRLKKGKIDKIGFKSMSKKAKLTHVFEKNPGLQFPFHRQVLQVFPFCEKFTSSVAVYRQTQLKEDLPQQERKNHNRILWSRKEIVRAALNKKKYR